MPSANLTTEDLTTRHEAGWYISETPMGVEMGRGRTPTQAIDAAARILCGLAAGPEDGPQEDEGEGDPTPPPDIYGYSPTGLVASLAAHVATTYADLLNPAKLPALRVRLDGREQGAWALPDGRVMLADRCIVGRQALDWMVVL